jgi:hypothetical protein
MVVERRATGIYNRNELNGTLSKAVPDFTEGIGIIERYNLLSEKTQGPFW